MHLSEYTPHNSDIIKRIRNLLKHYWEVGYRIVCATGALVNYLVVEAHTIGDDIPNHTRSTETSWLEVAIPKYKVSLLQKEGQDSPYLSVIS